MISKSELWRAKGKSMYELSGTPSSSVGSRGLGDSISEIKQNVGRVAADRVSLAGGER